MLNITGLSSKCSASNYGMVTAGFSPSKSSARWVLPRWILLIYLVLTVVPLVCHECSSPLSKFSFGSFDFGIEFVCWIPRVCSGHTPIRKAKDNGSCLGRYLGSSSNFGKASCCVIGLSLSPNNFLACLFTISFGVYVGT
ncbi:hypothetical protein V6N12_061016 [Hibiscus sabdariffa]|uniref:Uncharacterized protein n=1 Tax=Hibiscus sabdariffa TaxID=183260 RepID=A0ABR2DWE8_9ROSI